MADSSLIQLRDRLIRVAEGGDGLDLEPQEAELLVAAIDAAPDAADVFTAEELWMLYPYAQSEADDRERCERRTLTGCESGPWRTLAAKLRLQIERKKPGGSGV
jgi:hypothetical protein